MAPVLFLMCCAFWFLRLATTASGSPRRDDGPVQSSYYSNPSPVQSIQVRTAPRVQSGRFILDIANERTSYNRSMARSRSGDNLLYAKSVRGELNRPKYLGEAMDGEAWLRLRTTHMRSLQMPVSEKVPQLPSSLPALPNEKKTMTLRTTQHPTAAWQFGHDGHGAAVLGPRALSRLQRRDSRRLPTPDQNETLAPVTKRHILVLRRVRRTALDLLVACLTLMAVAACLAIAALWLRGRYRSRGGALYSTLGVSDPELPVTSMSDTTSEKRSSLSNDNDLSTRMTEKKAEWPHKLMGHSLSEPMVWPSKASGPSPEIRGKDGLVTIALAPDRRSLTPEARSSPLHGTDMSKTMLSPVTSESPGVVSGPQMKRKSMHVQPSKDLLQERSYSVSRTDVDSPPSSYSQCAASPEKKRKSLHVQSSKTVHPQRSYCVSRTDIDRSAVFDHQCAGKARSQDTSPTKLQRKERKSHGKGGKGGYSTNREQQDNFRTTAKDLWTSPSSPKKVSLQIEDFQQYPDPDDIRFRLDARSGPQPMFIRRSEAKTTPRRGAVDTATAVTSPTACSSVEPKALWCKGSLSVRASRSQSSSTESFESLAIIKHEESPIDADCCYRVIDTGPWPQLLALCKYSKPVDFMHIVYEDCEATKLCWNDPAGDVFRVLGSQGDRLVRVLQLRLQDVPWHATRVTVAQELSNLKGSVVNRTSAFFVDAKTSVVRDKYPKLLWEARLRHQEQGFASSDATSSKDLELVADYLVTEMQPRWSPLNTCPLSDPEQAVSVLSQTCWALAVAEAELEFEHRLPSISAVLVRPTRSPRVEFTLRSHIVRLPSAGIKVRLQGLQMARLRTGTRVECTDFARFREFARGEEEVAVCSRIAELLSKRPAKFEPLTNVLWLQHLADWLARQGKDTSAALAHWQGVLAASCSAEHAAGDSRWSPKPCEDAWSSLD